VICSLQLYRQLLTGRELREFGNTWTYGGILHAGCYGIHIRHRDRSGLIVGAISRK